SATSSDEEAVLLSPQMGGRGTSAKPTTRTAHFRANRRSSIQARWTDPGNRGDRANQAGKQARSAGPRNHLLRRRDGQVLHARVQRRPFSGNGRQTLRGW